MLPFWVQFSGGQETCASLVVSGRGIGSKWDDWYSGPILIVDPIIIGFCFGGVDRDSPNLP